MQTRELSVPGAFELTPIVHGDARGSFHEWFRLDRLRELTGHGLGLAQANCSVSSAGTLRGIHFADVPPSQAKYVTCLSGAVLDVVVDVRVGSPAYGRWEGVLLDDETRRCVYLSEGLGHAFMALEDRSLVTYLCSAPFAPGREHGVNPLDPAIGVQWPTTDRHGRDVTPLLSDKDRAAPTLEEARAQGLLPDYRAAQDFVATLR